MEVCLSIDPAAIAAELGQPVRLKTWSLIVTIFGDAVLPHGGEISASALNDVTSMMGVNGGAVRTALSRLASDGIIDRKRDGRSSLYRLSPDREQEFLAAAARIYVNSGQPGHAQYGHSSGHFLVAARNGELPVDGAIRLSREWWLVDTLAREDLSADHAVFEGGFSQLPDWMVRRVASPELAEAMRQLLTVFDPVLRDVGAKGVPEPLTALAIRCLLIHAWRRIALRLIILPEGFTPTDWPEAGCRELVAELYRKLQPVTDKFLDERLRSGNCNASARRFA